MIEGFGKIKTGKKVDVTSNDEQLRNILQIISLLQLVRSRNYQIFHKTEQSDWISTSDDTTKSTKIYDCSGVWCYRC